MPSHICLRSNTAILLCLGNPSLVEFRGCFCPMWKLLYSHKWTTLTQFFLGSLIKFELFSLLSVLARDDVCNILPLMSPGPWPNNTEIITECWRWSSELAKREAGKRWRRGVAIGLQGPRGTEDEARQLEWLQGVQRYYKASANQNTHLR